MEFSREKRLIAWRGFVFLQSDTRIRRISRASWLRAAWRLVLRLPFLRRWLDRLGWLRGRPGPP
jgi:hypothetical protein